MLLLNNLGENQIGSEGAMHLIKTEWNCLQKIDLSKTIFNKTKTT